MDAEMKVHRCLPPLVEGKIHDYLKFVIDEVIWSKRSPGEISVFASWWGEFDSAQFRPADITRDSARQEHETTEIYVIRTNLNLFKRYIKNCETIELVVVAEESNTIVGTAQVRDLLDIFEFKPYFKYFPILNDSGNKIGELHVSIKLSHAWKPTNMQLKTFKHDEKLVSDNNILAAINSFKSQRDLAEDRSDIYEKLKTEDNEVYKSILKSKRTDFEEPLKKFNNAVTDKLVAQVVARAQRLRGVILKETCNEDPLALSDSSMNDNLNHLTPGEGEAKLYEYFLGKEMSSSEERRALNTLRSTSPIPSLIDFASKSIETYRYNNKDVTLHSAPLSKTKYSMPETSSEEKFNKSKETLLLTHVDCIRIFVESFTLSPAGYRRVKSSSLLRNDSTPLSVTYIVQYDTLFGYGNQAIEKPMKENKPVRVCSKKQIDQVIYFNHDGTYAISKLKVHTNYLIKFKVLIRHLNRKSPTELGIGSMCISDIMKTENWSITQRLAIVNKGIKTGELSVTAELGSDFIHFGKQYVDGIMSAKENIPVLEMQPLLSVETSKKSKSATGTQSKTSSRLSSVPAEGVDCLTTDNNSDLFATKDLTQYRNENVEDKRVEGKNKENTGKDKTLLHGLIYVAEGKEMPELNTYLICRAFWKEDKATSQICSNTKNPFYHFCQLVPLIHGTDLLDRIKDNYVIIEVYCRSNDTDNLLGLVKLSVHQLYVAYRDPLVLPHLLLSKYPVISVDGWVPIVNPVNGQSCGQLLALVALGTAEQIALLEMTRGLRNISNIPQTIYSYSGSPSNCTKYVQSTEECTKQSQPIVETCSQDNFVFHSAGTGERESDLVNFKTQESQTDITTVGQSQFLKIPQEDALNSEHLVLHSLVNRLAQVLSANKANADQAAQTEMEAEEKNPTNAEEPICLNESNYINISDDSDSSSLRNNFHLPTDMYRSVGVGAEYDEELDQQPQVAYPETVPDLPNVMEREEKEQPEPECTQNATFRAVIEIECALHLPKVEKDNEAVEPTTYVSFQANKTDSANQLNSYLITNVVPQNCNPQWNWKCDARLPTELLLNDEKRLILKIWRILDPDDNMQINLERDIVIGFSAIDLSVLVTGFPTVSGWFHIIDFTGRCNGQIKVCITPLDNLSLFGKPVSMLSTARIPASNVSPLSWSPSYSHVVQPVDIEENNVNSLASTREDDKLMQNENQINSPLAHVGRGFEDVSMSFLSSSLKQTLTELDEITKRLESRLRDVTNTAFEDDFEFDLNEPSSEIETSEHKNSGAEASAATIHSSNRTWQTPQIDKVIVQNREIVEDANQTTATDTNFSKSSTSYARENLPNDIYQMQHQNEYPVQNNKPLENSSDHPVRGTKTHINYLLDKLSLQLPVRSFPAKSMPIRKNIADLLANLQQNNNNIQDNSKCNQELKTYTVETADGENIKNSDSQINRMITGVSDAYNDRNLSETSANSQTANRISTVIREELIAEENSDTSKCDELTTYLIASNVRHMDLDSIFNPLLYQHLVPDLHLSNAVSPEGEAVEQLDNRYTRAFTTSIDSRLSKVNNLMDNGETSMNGSSTQERSQSGVFESSDNAELFRMTPSGVSENVDGNIDLTVIHKSSYNDLMASNSTESTTTISPEKSPIKQIEVGRKENSYSTSSESSVLAISRQAPDGGNPIEDITKPLIVQQQDDSQDSSSSS